MLSRNLDHPRTPAATTARTRDIHTKPPPRTRWTRRAAMRTMMTAPFLILLAASLLPNHGRPTIRVSAARSEFEAFQ